MNSKYFIIQEYVPKIIFDTYGINSSWFVDPRLIKLDDFIREWFDEPITINNWWWVRNGMQNRGFRTPTTKVGGKLSQHRFGRASDKSFAKLTIKEAFNEIMKYEKVFFDQGLRCMEDIAYTPTWLHSDIRETGLDKILIVKP